MLQKSLLFFRRKRQKLWVQLFGVGGDAIGDTDSQGVEVVVALEAFGLAGVGAIPQLDQDARHA